MAPRSRVFEAFAVAVVGRGRVGRTLARASRPSIGASHQVLDVTLVSGRGCDTRVARDQLARARVVWLTVPDGAVGPTAARIAALGVLSRSTVVFHAAGGLGLDALDPIRTQAHVGALHPLVSFADVARPPPLAGTTLVAEGAAPALRAARLLARAYGAHLLVASSLDRALYHAAAALLANGAAALAAVSLALLERAGLPSAAGAPTRALAMLLSSVAHNIGALGPRDALTGPIVRGDTNTVERHLARLDVAAPEAAHVYRDIGRTILTLARARGLDERNATHLDELLSRDPTRR